MFRMAGEGYKITYSIFILLNGESTLSFFFYLSSRCLLLPPNNLFGGYWANTKNIPFHIRVWILSNVCMSIAASHISPFWATADAVCCCWCGWRCTYIQKRTNEKVSSFAQKIYNDESNIIRIRDIYTPSDWVRRDSIKDMLLAGDVRLKLKHWNDYDDERTNGKGKRKNERILNDLNTISIIWRAFRFS